MRTLICVTKYKCIDGFENFRPQMLPNLSLRSVSFDLLIHAQGAFLHSIHRFGSIGENHCVQMMS